MQSPTSRQKFHVFDKHMSFLLDMHVGKVRFSSYSASGQCLHDSFDTLEVGRYLLLLVKSFILALHMLYLNYGAVAFSIKCVCMLDLWKIFKHTCNLYSDSDIAYCSIRVTASQGKVYQH